VLTIDIPGYGELRLEHLVLDYNGTLAGDGQLIGGVGQRLDALVESLQIHVITADTFGSVRTALRGLPCKLAILPPGQQDEGKRAYVAQLGFEASVCVGNGRNDRLMLEAAALGIAVLQTEGAASVTLSAADLVVPDILAALDLLARPNRLVATLRN